ncbi:hypothetical protein [Staphylococcus phage ZCSS1]|uniref:Uncharacterized protein n=1 Tax=Staphylococcus phage UHP46 TaxID=3234966 RepID=A0AB39C854_9CAUD|nr:hypothetical protein [Staphylococcus phage ZCSS1]
MFSLFKNFRPTFMYKDIDNRYSKFKEQFNKSDKEQLQSDWEQVGKDMKKAIKGEDK